jgi:HK97 family phage portal protein
MSPFKQLSRLRAVMASSVAGWIGRHIGLTDGGFWSAWFGPSNFTGKSVTVNSVLQLSTGWACVRLISETLSTLPVNMLKEQKSGAKVVARNHNLHYLIHTQPNAEMTAAVFWQVFLASMLLWGAAWVEKHVSAGVIVALEFLYPDGIRRQKLDNGRWQWRYADPKTGKERVIAAERMWFTPFFTLDGCTVLSPVRLGANVFGGAMASDEASAQTFTNGIKSSGVITMDAVLKKEQRDEIRTHVKKVSDEGGVFVLEKGAGYQQLTMNPQDAELLSTRAFSVEEICRWFRVDPSLVGHGSKDSNWGTGLEEKMLWLVTMTLRPLVVRIEQSIRKDLLTPEEQMQFSAEFALEGLLRGDSKSRASFYSTMTQNGIYTRDECRVLENREPHGGNAEVLTVQSNMLPIDKLGQMPADKTAQEAIKAWLGIETVTAGAPAKEQENA